LYVLATYSLAIVREKEVSAMSEAKSARINLRLSPEALETVREAAAVQQQDLTSFVLGAAMERARAVLAEDRILRLTPHEVNQLERALDSDPEVVPQLRAFIRRLSADDEIAVRRP
jgi:uncharacterized protein (DUF1778 family)